MKTLNSPVNIHSLPPDPSTGVQRVLVAEILHASDETELDSLILDLRLLK